VIFTLFIHGHRFTFKHLCWHLITKILRNGPKAHFPFTKALVGFSRDRSDTGNYSGELDRAKSAGHRASTVDRRGRAPAKAKLDEHRAQ
jgi:hypothetical protein